jgi:hypothetical protein
MDCGINKMKYNVELNDEAMDAIFRNILVEDYRRLKEDIKRLKKKHKNDGLKTFEYEDLINNIRFRDAMKVLIGYYFAHEEAQTIIKKKQI